MTTLIIESADLHMPSLEELVPILKEGFIKYFKKVEVNIVDCPKMKAEPFHLAAEGICGRTSIIDVGGPPYLLPLAQTNKPQYKFDGIFEMLNYPEGLLIGAGAGPHQHIGINCEMTANVWQSNGKLLNESRVCKMVNNTYQLQKLDTGEFALLGNFLCSEGKPGKVLEIIAADRISEMNYTSCIRQILQDHYAEEAVGLGGVFLIEKGKAKIHVMPKFSSEPLYTDDDVNRWLKFFEMDAPLICVGELVSHDPGLDLRMEHFHCFSTHGDGGHYHYDTTPESVVYRGYFTVAEQIHRIDRPDVTHNVGRD